MKLLKWLFFIIPLSCLLLLSLFGSIIGEVINYHFKAIDERFGKNQLTQFHKLECSILYHSMAFTGKIFYPEAGHILEHYIQSSGENLHIDADYIKKSPVVLTNLKSIEVGETRKVRFNQKEDWRLSYALNPFSIKKGKHEVIVYQKIIFPKEKGVYINMNLFLFKIKLPDRLIHVLNPKPFMVHSEWVI